MIKPPSIFRRAAWHGVSGAALAVAVGLFLYGFPLGDPLARLSYDLPQIFQTASIPEVVLVYLDPEIKAKLGEPKDVPLDRRYHSRLLDRLTDQKARLVICDIIFDEPASDPAVDQTFARALQRNGTVVLVGYEKTTIRDGAATLSTIAPIPVLRDAAAGWGLAGVARDSDLAIRRIYPGNRAHPSASWVAASLLGAATTRLPGGRLFPKWLNYYGPPEGVRSIDFDAALRDDLDPLYFRDALVVIGSGPGPDLAGADRDEFANPFSRFGGRFSTGAHVHALSLLNLLRGDWWSRFPPALEIGTLLFVGLGAGFAFALMRPIPCLVAALVAGGGILLVAQSLAWHRGLWFAWLILVVQITVAWMYSSLSHSIRSHIEKKNLEHSLGLYLSPKKVQEILKKPEALQPGADEQDIAIMFTDIANFSGIAGQMVARDLARLLNGYFEASLSCIHRADGTVIKLIGDAIFAIWNAPLPQPDASSRAVHAALELRDQLVQFDSAQETLPLRTRVGLHFGRACVGNFGSARRLDYTAIGDAVNLASRLEGLNKYLGTELLATRDIQQSVEREVVSRLVGHFALKGIGRPVEVHEIISTSRQAADSEPWRSSFSQALHRFRRRAFSEAKAGFEKTLQLRPGDGPSLFYLERIETFLKVPPPSDWTGEIVLQEK